MPPKTFHYGGINYEFPEYNASGLDNVHALGQEIQLPKSKYLSVQILAAAQSGMASGTINATYADGSTSSSAILVPPWWSQFPPGGDLVFPYFLTSTSVNYNRSNIFQSVSWLDSSKELVSLTLPNVTGGADSSQPGGASIDTKLHIFALSMWPVGDVSPGESRLQVQYARSTQKWMEGTNRTQVYEVHLNNIGSAFVLRNNTVTVSVESPGLKTISPGIVKRLAPGDQVVVEIGVTNNPGIAAGKMGPATVVVSGQGISNTKYTFDAMYGILPYEASYESVYTHEAPGWYNNAKYGIFIHWGPYAAPGWGNSGSKEQYAEW